MQIFQPPLIWEQRTLTISFYVQDQATLKSDLSGT